MIPPGNPFRTLSVSILQRRLSHSDEQSGVTCTRRSAQLVSRSASAPRNTMQRVPPTSAASFQRRKATDESRSTRQTTRSTPRDRNPCSTVHSSSFGSGTCTSITRERSTPRSAMATGQRTVFTASHRPPAMIDWLRKDCLVFHNANSKTPLPSAVATHSCTTPEPSSQRGSTRGPKLSVLCRVAAGTRSPCGPPPTDEAILRRRLRSSSDRSM